MKKRLLIGLLSGVCTMSFANTKEVSPQVVNTTSVVVGQEEAVEGFWCELLGLAIRIGGALGGEDVGHTDSVAKAAVATCNAASGNNTGSDKNIKKPEDTKPAVDETTEA